jgi:hypothetical protein
MVKPEPKVVEQIQNLHDLGFCDEEIVERTGKENNSLLENGERERDSYSF